MEDSFKARVHKVFGSLASSPSSSLWSIADDDLERREWRRCAHTSARDETPCSSSFHDLLNNDRRVSRRRSLPQELQDDTDAQQTGWDIRSSIGLDPTLDFEEEEDEFDKVASGRENAGDRLYMSDVTEEGSYLNSDNVLTNRKDPRANHLAAKFRLKEDDDQAQKIGSDAEGSKHEAQPRPISKRKANKADFKSPKRVRFDVDSQHQRRKYATVSDSDRSSGLPDYVVNPSKYTRYSLDSTSEADEASNAQACGDFLSQVKSLYGKLASDGENTSSDLPKSIPFIPKKTASKAKAVDDSNNRGQTLHREGVLVGIAVGEVEDDISEVDKEDEPQIKAAEGGAGFQKPGRRYRTMSKSDDSGT